MQQLPDGSCDRSGNRKWCNGRYTLLFCNDPNSHRYVPSPRNQRIEGWSSFLRKNQTSWWIDFFNDLIAAGISSLTDQLDKKIDNNEVAI